MLIGPFLLPASAVSQEASAEEGLGLELMCDYRALQPGEAVKIVLTAEIPLQKAVLKFQGSRFNMGPGAEARQWLCLLGLDMGLNPGTYTLEATVLSGDGRQESVRRDIEVLAKEFPVKKLWVDQKFVTPPQELMERIRRESELMRVVYDIFTPQWMGDGPFIIPSEGEAVPNFGERRVFNNQPRSRHSGIDISTPFGYPVKASNAGRVVLANNLYFAGNTVIIDHGLGVFTLYCHFSKILVKRDQMVAKGDVVGEIGATGRVTGPHLHWGVRILQTRIDPLSMVALPFSSDIPGDR